MAPILKRYETGELLLFTMGDERKLSKTAVAANVGVFSTLIGKSDIERGFDRALEIFGSKLKMVDFDSRMVTPDLLNKANDAGVLLSIAGDCFEDYRLVARDPKPWLKALESGAVAFWTAQPEALLKLLGK